MIAFFVGVGLGVLLGFAAATVRRAAVPRQVSVVFTPPSPYLTSITRYRTIRVVDGSGSPNGKSVIMGVEHGHRSH
jgi:hypothetical protein